MQGDIAPSINSQCNLDPQGSKGYLFGDCENMLNFSHQLEFGWKSKTSFIDKTIIEKTILDKFWACRVVRTIFGGLKILNFLNFCHHLEF